MWRGVRKVSVSQDVCIFCALRMSKASAEASSRSQRRSFMKTSLAQKPPASPATARQKQKAGSQDWATWSPPPEASQPPVKSLKVEKQAVKERTRSSTPHIQSQRWSIGRQSPSTQNSFAAGFRKFIPSENQQEQRPHAGQVDLQVAVDPSATNENSWQGLRRKIPPAKPLENVVGKPLHRHAQSDTSYSKQEQKRRLEESKHGRFVGLQGLQRPPIRSMERPDMVAPTPNPSGNRNADPSPSVAASSQTNGPSIHVNQSTKPAAKSDGGWTTYHPPVIQQGPREATTHNAVATPEDKETRSLKGYGRWANLASATTDNSIARFGETLSRGTDSEDHQDQNPPNSAVYNRSRDSRRQKPERESEIVVPRGYETRSGSFDRRKKNKRSVPSGAAEEDFDIDEDGLSQKRAARKLKAKKAEVNHRPPTPIYLPPFISVSNLAVSLRIRVEQFLQEIRRLGFEDLSSDHVLDAETAGLIANEYNFEPVIDRSEGQDLKALTPIEDKSTLPARPPIITIMGHVDHGKTTLLDFLRKSSVAASEHGGITQHIGAFSVPMPGGRLVTFLDTPGHAAFLSMRQRGAHVTDIVILVVAADDSVKPQTIEAIRHAQAAKVPIIVAINKIDKEDARPEQVKQDLARYGVEVEDFGGDTQVVCVSGKTGQGMAELEDAAVALADILDMRAPADGLAEGWVLEATTRRAGRVATVLIRRGTLRPGDLIVAGTSYARIRSLRNEADILVDSAGPGTPVSVDGWNEQPTAGDEVLQSPGNNRQKAKAVIAHRLAASQDEQLAKDVTAVNEARRIEQEKREALELAAQTDDDNQAPLSTDSVGAADTTLNANTVFFILKADVSGSVEAVASAILALGSTDIHAQILRSGVGPITEFDIDHAAVAQGHIVNFNMPIEGAMARLAETKGVRILDQSIIYRIIDQVKGVLEERLAPLVTRRVLGEAEVAQLFDINVKGRIRVPFAGCKVRNGEIARSGKVRVLRAGDVIYDGTLSSLKNVKKDITEARKGTECGIGFEGWTLFKVGDQVQCYEEKSEPRKL